MSDQRTNELVAIVNEGGLAEAEARDLITTFSEISGLAASWEAKAKEIVVTDESQTDLMKVAREGRLLLRKARINVENTRKSLKESALRRGQAIDKVAKFLKGLIEPIEKHLDEQEHFVENKRKAEEEARRLKAEQLLREQEDRERLEREAEEKRVREENERKRKEAEAEAAKLRAEAEAREAEIRKEREAKERELAAEREKAESARRAAIEEEHRKAEEARLKREAELVEERRLAEERAEQRRKEYEAQIAAERRAASMVTCPHCGHRFSTEE